MLRLISRATIIILIGLTCFFKLSDRVQKTIDKEKIRGIYLKLLAQTGLVQDALPLNIIESSSENAYNDGQRIVIYTGLIENTRSEDEIALVLAHEIAHGMLGHLTMLPKTNTEISILESNADKMGAVYMMKAGYNICKGRLIFKRWREINGNALGQTHPDQSYRYEELNIGCE